MRSSLFQLSTVSKAKNHPRVYQLLILISFLITFGFIRAVTHLQKFNLLPNQASPSHIHHMVPGIILVLISGYVGISFWENSKIRWFVSILFGIGAALTIDEFALWLFLKDVYWAKQGRDSVDAIVLTALLFAIIFTVSEIQDHRFIKRVINRLQG